MLKAYEFEKGRFVTFTAAELKALGEASRPTIDIVSFVPEHSVDPIYFDKAYYLAPDKPGGKPYSLLHAAMRASGRSALARWAWRAKEYVVQIRPAGAGFVLQQLLYADEVRSIDELHIELSEVGAAELDLALRLIGQIGADGYDPHAFVDEEKQRILAAVERKIAGRKVIATPVSAPAMPSAQVIDLVAALRASLGALPAAPRGTGARTTPARGASAEVRERKPARRAAKKAAAPAAPAAPAGRNRRARRAAPARKTIVFMSNDLSGFPVTRKWPARHPDRLQLYSLPTPNGVKVSIALEEIGLPYEPHRVSFDQQRPEVARVRGAEPVPEDPGDPRPRRAGRAAAGAVRVGRDPAVPRRKDRASSCPRTRRGATRRCSG